MSNEVKAENTRRQGQDNWDAWGVGGPTEGEEESTQEAGKKGSVVVGKNSVN